MKRKDQIKAILDINLKSIYSLPPDLNGKEIIVYWKRGSKGPNKGKTDAVTIKDGLGTLGSNFSLVCTLVKNIKTQKFEEKSIEFEVKQIDNKKKETSVLKGELDLSNYSEPVNHENVIASLDSKKSKRLSISGSSSKKEKTPSIKLDIKTKWTHMNKKKLIAGKKEPGKESIKIGGVEYGLATDSDAVSCDDTTAGEDLSESDDDDEIWDEDEKEKKVPDKSPSDGAQKKKKKKKKIKSPKSESGSKSKSGSTDGSSDEIAQLKKKLEEKTKEVSDLTAKLEKSEESSKDNLGTLTKQKHELKKLKSENVELKKVKKTSSNSNLGKDAGAKELETLKIEKEKLQNEVKDLQSKFEKEKSEKEKLKTEKEKLSSEKEKLSTEKDKLSTEKDKLSSEKEKLNAEKEKLKTEKEKLKSEVTEIKTTAAKSGSSSAESTKALNDLQESLKKSKAKSKKKGKDIETLKENLKQKEENLNQQVELFKKMKDEVSKVKEDATAQHSKLKSRLETQEKEFSEKSKKLADENAKKDSEISELKSNVESEKKRSVSVVAPVIVGNDDEVNKLKEENGDLEKQINKLKKDKTEKEEDFDKLKKEKDESNKRVEKLKKEKEEIQSNYEKVTKEATSSANEKKALEDKIKVLMDGKQDDLVKNLQEREKSLKEEIEKLKKNNEKDVEKVKQEKADISANLENLKKAKEEIGVNLEKSRKEHEATVEKLKSDLEKVNKEVEKVNNEKIEVGGKVSKLEKEIERLKKSNDKKNSDNSGNDLAKELESKDAKIDDLEVKLKIADEKKDQESKQVEKLKKQLKEAENSASEKSETLHKKIKNLEEKISDLEKKLQKKQDENRKQSEKIKDLEAGNGTTARDFANIPSSSSNGTNGDSGDVERLKQQFKDYEVEKEENLVIENHIYCMSAKYEEDVHLSAAAICSKLIEWKTLDEPTNERLLKKILNGVQKAYQAHVQENQALVQWLSFACMLHEQLEQEVGTTEDPNTGDLPENGIHVRTKGTVVAVDEEDPVSKFFWDLETIIFEIYCALVKNVSGQIDKIVIPAILDQTKTMWDKQPKKNDKKIPANNSVAPIRPKQISNLLDEYLDLLVQNKVFSSVVQQFLCQLFYIIDVKLFNTILKKKELCSCSSGFQIKLGLSELEEWVNKHKAERELLMKGARKYLAHITEVANVLVVDKNMFKDETMISTVFPSLKVGQIYHVLERFQIDQFAPERVPADVLQKLKDVAKKDGDEIELNENHKLRWREVKE